MMRRVQWPPQRAVRLLHRVWVGREDLRHVERATFNVGTMPEEVQDSNRAVRSWGSYFGKNRHLAPEPICRDPPVGQGVNSTRRGQTATVKPYQRKNRKRATNHA